MSVGRVVFDCNVFAQKLLNPNGPAGRCIEFARSGHVELFVSDFILFEVGALFLKLPPRAHISTEDIEDLIRDLLSFVKMIDVVQAVYLHPIDTDDSAYVNLAIAANADLIVSRDKHLLGLTDATKNWSEDFRALPEFARAYASSISHRV